MRSSRFQRFKVLRKLKRLLVIKRMISAEECEQLTNRLMEKKEYKQLSIARFTLLQHFIYDCFLIGGRMWVTDGELRKQLEVFMKWLLDEKIERKREKNLTLSR